MICRLNDEVVRGRAVTVETDIDPAVVASAVRTDKATADETTVTVQARTPHSVHEHVGCLHPEMGLRVRTALARAARCRGLSTVYDTELAETRARLEELTVEHVDRADQRRAVAEESAETDRLRERVAETRGRLDAYEELGHETDELADRLEDAARDLSEVETSAVAARQTLDQRRRKARATRDELDRRMRLEDEVANLQRRARSALVERVRDAYESAVASVPGGPDHRPADPFDVDSLTAGLAVARVASLSAPLVVACDRFGDAHSASAVLDAPVIRVR